jgi:hypothetical protein
LANHYCHILLLVFMMFKRGVTVNNELQKMPFYKHYFGLLGSLTFEVLNACKLLHNWNVIKFYSWTLISIEHWNIV